jgi:hypothetical protein
MAAEERRLGDWLSSWAHNDAHAVCGPGLTPQLGLSSWPAMYPNMREMLHMTFSYTLLSRCHLSIANRASRKYVSPYLSRVRPHRPHCTHLIRDVPRYRAARGSGVDYTPPSPRPRGGDDGARGGMHDLAVAARFWRTLMAGDGVARGTEGRVDLDRSHDVSFRNCNQKWKRSKW